MSIKKILFIFGFALIAINVNAQKVRFGLRGGLNISNESSHDYSFYCSTDQKFKAAVNAGGMLNFSLTDKFEIETDLLYSMQGFKDIVYTLELEQNISNTNYTVTSHYLNVPVSVKYYILNGFYAECGPQIGFLLKKKDKVEGRESMNSYDSSSTKKTDFGLLVGLGYRFSNDVFVNARYIHGLTGTSKVYEGGKNRNIQLSLGYIF